MLFISHSTKDKATALELQQRLLQRGYEASQLFLDSDATSGIPAGSKWEQVLYNRLKDCRALIVLCSTNWQQSKWCFAELVYAKALGKEVFPVLLEACDLGGVASEFQGIRVYQEGEVAYERLWSALESRHLSPQDDFGWNPDECPFPGLMAFDEKYAGVYFGREPETQTVLQELRKMRNNGEPRLLMIVGGSGSGKSSLLRSGVLPRLKHKTADTDWLVLPTLRYGEAPNEDYTIFDQLARDLVALFPADAKNVQDWKVLRDQFAGDDVEQAAQAFSEVTQDLTLARGCRDATVLLAIDQFEELLPPAGGRTADQLMRFLCSVFIRRNGRLLAIGTLRSDYLDVYQQHPHALTDPFFRPWPLGPFPRERIGDVIVKPASRAHMKMADDLLERLKQDTPTSEALPLLAFTLEKLYRRHAGDELLELQEYLDLGGMEGAIQKSINRIIPPSSLSPEQTAALRLSFVKYLAQVNDKDEIVRRVARWSDLPAPAQPVLDQFVKERLLVKSECEAQVQVEVAHEAMFRCWPLLQTWLGTSAAILRWRRDVNRDRITAGSHWRRLTPLQLAVARRWHLERRNELTEEEVTWIKRGIRKEWLTRIVVAAVILVVSGLGGFAFVQWNRAEREKDAAQHNLAIAHLESGKSEIEQGHLAAGIFEYWRAYANAPKGDALRVSARALVASWSKQLGMPFVHDAPVTCVAFSPDGQTVLTGSWDRTARLWDAQTGQPKETLPHNGRVVAVAFSPDGQTVLTGSWDQTARLWDARTGQPKEPLPHNGRVVAVAFSRDGQTVLTGSTDQTARLWDAQTGQHKKTLPHNKKTLPHNGEVEAVAFSPDGLTVLTGSRGNNAQLWDARTGQPKGQLRSHKDSVVAVAFSRDGQTILTGSRDQTAQLWDARTGQPYGEPLFHNGAVEAVAFSPDGQTVLTGSRDTNAQLWDTRTGKAKGQSLPHNGEVWAVAFSPDGQTVLTGSDDHNARLWDARSGQPKGKPLPHNGEVRAVAFSPDGQAVLTGGKDQTARLWDPRSGQPKGTPLYYNGSAEAVVFSAVAFSPDGQTMLTGSWKETAQLWDVRTGQPKGQPLPHNGAVEAVAFSPDGQTILTGSDDRKARLWDAQTGQLKGTPLPHGGRVSAVAFSSDGQTILTGSTDKTARLWDARTGQPKKALPYNGLVGAVAFSPDGQTVLTGSDDNDARLWDTRTGQPIGAPLPHGGRVLAVAFSPDGQTILTDRDDRKAQLWDARTGQPKKTLPYNGLVKAVAFSPDGQIVLTGSDDNNARLWDTRTSQPIGAPLPHGGRVLAVAFSPDGQTILTGSRDKTAQLWDVRTGQPKGQPLPHNGAVGAVAFSPDGRTVLTSGWDDTARLWAVVPPAIDDREKLQLSVEVRTGLYLDQGTRKELTQAQWLQRREKLDKFYDVRSWDHLTDAEKLELRTPPNRK
jgi:WD40 repeat protein